MTDEIASITTAHKIQFLRQPASYCLTETTWPTAIEVIETHMAWVFLTERFAYKLKKPVRYAFLDFSTLASRYQDAQAELRLNRRLAPWVYLAVVPLWCDRTGQLHLNGPLAIPPASVVDWLVKMRRLSASAMLDRAIAQGQVSAAEVELVAQHLVNFYRSLAPEPLTAAQYRQQLAAELAKMRRGLLDYADGLPAEWLRALLDRLEAFLASRGPLFDQRVRQGKIIEGHGDLRPEHICLRPQVAIIDCLAFNRDLRILDVVDELAFLALECERLGASWVGDRILEVYTQQSCEGGSGNRAAAELIKFYQAYRACMRAQLAIWHIAEPGQFTAEHWLARARAYLRLAQRCPAP